MALQSELALLVILGLGRLEVGVERCLDVHDEMPVVGHLDDHVGTNDLAVADRVGLLDEVAVLDHAREFDEAPQRDLAPATAHLGSAQCLDQVLRFLRQGFLTVLHFLELAANAAVGLASRLFEFRDLLVGCFQCIADRFDEVLDSFLALAEIPLGLLLLRFEVLPCQPEEGVAIGLQRLVRNFGKRLFQAGIGKFEGRLTFREGRCFATAADQPHDGDSKHQPEPQRGQADLDINRV